MRRATLLMAALIWLAGVYAHAGPQVLTYQGSVQDPGGTPVADGAYTMRFTVYDAQLNGSNLWQEINDVEVTGGRYSIVLGESTAFNDLFSTHSDLWLEVAIDVDQSGSIENDEVFGPRQRMTSAAWAMEADAFGGGALDDVTTVSFTMPHPVFHRNVGFNAFSETDLTNNDYVNDLDGYLKLDPDSALPYLETVRAEVQLPQGATVTELRPWLLDNHTNGFVSVTLYRYPNGGAAEEMASFETGNVDSDASVQSPSITAVNHALIDNRNYHYGLRVVLVLGTEGATDEIRFYNARIAFTLPAVAY